MGRRVEHSKHFDRTLKVLWRGSWPEVAKSFASGECRVARKRLDSSFEYFCNNGGRALEEFYKAPEFRLSSLLLGEVVGTYGSKRAVIIGVVLRRGHETGSQRQSFSADL